MGISGDKKQVVLIIAIFFCSFWTQAQIVQVEDPVKFLALGDSYTIGESVAPNLRWPRQLMDSLVERGYSEDFLQVIATTGWRTDQLISAINSGNVPNDFNLVSLLIGVNNQFQGRPTNVYAQEFEQLLQIAIQKAGGDTSKVFVVSIPDYAYTTYGQSTGNASQISAAIDTFNAINLGITEIYGITYVNITDISRLGVQQPNLVANDGLHPSGIQYSAWVERILNDNYLVLELDEKMEEEVLQCYPNPNKNLLNFDKSVASWTVRDIEGRVLLKGMSLETTHQLLAGIYYVEMKGQSGDTSTQRIVIK